MIHDVGKQSIGNGIQQKSSQRFPHRIIQQVNKEEGKSEVRKRKIKTGMIQVLGLRHKREKQSDPRLACFMHVNIVFSSL